MLNPLPIPEDRFASYSLDFMTNLPSSLGYKAILTIVERLTKYTRFIPCKLGEDELPATKVAQLFFEHIVRAFGVPQEIVSDRDRRFTSTFWQHLWKLLGTKTLMSTAFHPQTDGQTERMHRTLS